MRGLATAVLGLVVVAGTACGGEAPTPSGPRSITKDGWEEWIGGPAWATTPPRHEGYAPLVVAAQSDLLDLIFPPSNRKSPGTETPKLDPESAATLVRRLRPVLGLDADAAVEKGAAPAELRRKGYAYEPPPPGQDPPAPGAQTYTGYQLWEVPVDAILAAVPAAQREAAGKALARLDPETTPAWESPSAAPAWAAAPPPREGFVTVLVTEGADRADLARVNAMRIGPDRAWTSLGSAITTATGRKDSYDVARAAFTWATVRARASFPAGRNTRCVTLWDVPIERVLEKIPEDARARVRRALEAPLRGG